MKIKDLKESHPRIYALALQRQQEAGNLKDDENIFDITSCGGFNWGKTPEGASFWESIVRSNFQPFYDKYPEEYMPKVGDYVWATPNIYGFGEQCVKVKIIEGNRDRYCFQAEWANSSGSGVLLNSNWSDNRDFKVRKALPHEIPTATPEDNHNGFIIGKVYKSIDSGALAYYCGLTNRKTPAFELINTKGVGITDVPEGWTPKGNGTYWRHEGLDKKFDLTPIECPDQPKTPDDLLAEAKKRYPIGTKYRCAKGICSVSKVESEDKIKFCQLSGKDIDIIGRGYLYTNGKWAEIISTPTVEEDVKITEQSGGNIVVEYTAPPTSYKIGDPIEILPAPGEGKYWSFEDGEYVIKDICEGNRPLILKTFNSDEHGKISSGKIAEQFCKEMDYQNSLDRKNTFDSSLELAMYQHPMTPEEVIRFVKQGKPVFIDPSQGKSIPIHNDFIQTKPIRIPRKSNNNQ